MKKDYSMVMTSIILFVIINAGLNFNIIQMVRKKNGINTLILVSLAFFAVGASIFQSVAIVKNVKKHINNAS
ncbi:hypothetical protein KM915_06655 [Cytobacillus oceanisediminis]|uniref:hypothetical protein n=1 Tax=Cytobacillus oceanisediminis TaxID=665099 RepID=UPI001C242852|nr:hypothetical protein [Cytobacillus oceanisediminis]MBU8729734.1 hypothetical protein [Cytobacillus oceanisediminis]